MYQNRRIIHRRVPQQTPIFKHNLFSTPVKKKRNLWKKEFPRRPPPKPDHASVFFCIYPRRGHAGPSAPLSYLSTIEPHDYPPARNAIGSGETVTLSVSRARVRRVSGQTSSTSTQHRANARHTTTRDGYYRFDDNVSLFGDERTNERTTQT